MSDILSPPNALINQDFSDIFDSALRRFGGLLPPETEVVVDLMNEHPRVRADRASLESVILSASLLAWYSSRAASSQVVIESSEIMLDNIVLDGDAEVLQGGLPPRLYARLVFSNSQLNPPSGLHLPMRHTPDSGASPHRLRLPQMQAVMAQHKGTITTFGDTGRGTAFEIYIPTALPFARSDVGPTGSSVKHIVYIDDYKEMRELASEVLADAGFRISSFERASEVLNLLGAGKLDCDALVSDYKLIDLTGIDLLRQVKALRPELPVIIVSGYVDAALRSQAQASGAEMVLSKSDDFNELCIALRHILQADPTSAMGSFTDWSTL
jgi:two-component system, cell cycle sensor histidine kinase and response regulator CckA